MTHFSKTILLVDDDRFMLEITGKALQRAGFKCLKALSAEKALAILNSEMPDLILSDYDMPVMDGFAFRQVVLANPELRKIPFVFLTSFTDEDLMMKGLDLRAIDYITKNTSINVIISKLNNLIATVEGEHERSLSELKKAAQALNLRSVPVASQRIDGYVTHFFHQSFQTHPGGDFIDFIELNDRYTFYVLGDVMGKNWESWFFSFSFLSYVRSAVRLCVLDGNFSPAGILQKLNTIIGQDPLLKDVVVKLSLMRLETATGQLTCSGAGNLPLWYFKNGAAVHIGVDNPVLGVETGAIYYESEITMMNSSDKLIIVSDGITEHDGRDKRGEVETFEVMLTKIVKTAADFHDMKAALEKFFDANKTTDNCSMIYLERMKVG